MSVQESIVNPSILNLCGAKPLLQEPTLQEEQLFLFQNLATFHSLGRFPERVQISTRLYELMTSTLSPGMELPKAITEDKNLLPGYMAFYINEPDAITLVSH